MRLPSGSYPELVIRLDLLRRNAGTLACALAGRGIALRGVTKACHGDERVASAMLEGGAAGLADSRAGDLLRLREALPGTELAMLLPAAGSELAAASGAADLFLAGSEAMLEDLAGLGEASGTSPRVVLMVETGGGREGMPLDQAPAVMRRAARRGAVELVGLGTHTACRGGPPPPSCVELLRELADCHRDLFAAEGPLISAGNSALLPAALGGELPAGVELRIGEALLLGRETTRGERLPDLRDDAFTLLAEVVESKEARGDGGRMETRLLVAVGRSDLGAGSITPRGPGLRVLEYFGDLTLLAGERDCPRPERGEALAFSLDYQGVLGAMSGTHVNRDYQDGGAV